MCELCGTEEERKIGRRQIRRLADDIQALAERYYSLEAGRIKPHSDQWKDVRHLGRSVIRRLIEDWV